MNKIIINVIIGVSTLVLLNGCMHETKKLSPSKSNRLNNKTISFVPLDTLTHPNDGTAAVGITLNSMILSSVLKGISNNVMSHPKYFYPTGILGSKAINTLAKNRGMIIKPSNQATDYKLEVKTYWYYKGAPFQWQQAQVLMENDIRLKDAKSGKIIAQAFCEYNTRNVKDIPTYNYSEIKKSNSQAVKVEANKAINLCIKKLKNEVLR